MFKSTLCPDEHCFDGTKLYFSVSHFSVFAFVQANLTKSSRNHNPPNLKGLPFATMNSSPFKFIPIECSKLQNE